MTTYAFDNINAESLRIKYHCDDCKCRNESENISIPLIENDSFDDDYYKKKTEINIEIYCKNCKKKLTIRIENSYKNGFVSLSPYDSEFEFFEMNNQLDAILNNTEFYQNFVDEIDKIEKLLSIKNVDNETKDILYKQIFTSLITILETYLCETFINSIFRNKKYLSKFVETYKEFQNTNLKLSDVINKYNIIDEIVKETILNIVFHNLSKVKNIYYSVFEIDFPRISDCIVLVNKRHNIVHRNGYEKNGKKINITDNDINEAIITLKQFVKELDNQMKKLDVFRNIISMKGNKYLS